MKPAYWFLLSIVLSAHAWSADADEAPPPMTVRDVDIREASNNISGAGQSSDGALWLGTTTQGLYVYDGARFGRFQGGPAGQPASNAIQQLVTWPDDGLWIGYTFGGLGHFKNGRWTEYGEKDGVPVGTVISIFRDPAHTPWVAARSGMARLSGGKWEAVPLMSDSHVSFLPYQALFDPNGALWVTSADRVYVRSPGEDLFREVATLEFAANSYLRAIALAPDGALWIADPNGLTRVKLRPILTIYKYSLPQAVGAVFDREGNLWLGSYSPSPDAQLRWLPSSAVKSDLTEAELKQRLVSVPVPGFAQRIIRPMLEDREGNIWAVGTRMYRLSRSTIATFYEATGYGSLAVIAADGTGTLWIAATHGTDSELLEVKDGKIRSRQPTRKLTSSCRDRDGTLWFAGPGVVAHLVAGKLALTALPDSLGGYDVQTVIRDVDGALWVSVVRKGLFRYVDGNWQENGGYSNLPKTSVVVATLAADGTLWMGYAGNRVARIYRGIATVFTAADGIDVGNVTAIGTGAQLLIGGDTGLLRFNGRRFSPILGHGAKGFLGVTGIVENDSSDLWLSSRNGISHVSGDEFARNLANSTYQPKYEVFDYLDGLQTTSAPLRPMPSAVAAGGLIWFSLNGGHVVSIDPHHIIRNALAPPVSIWSITAQDKKYDADHGPINLPMHTTSLQVEYSAGSLTIPERVHFRHKLDGLDSDWQDGGNRRDAFYTNLSPGSYIFRVIASNNDGVWNNEGASLRFTIAPAWYQTRWFIALMAVGMAVVLWLLAHWRLRAVHRRMRVRLEERLGERERIARELHDTFLQSVQGLMLKFQSAAQKMPDSEPARQSIEQSLDHADQVIIEGRDRVNALRRMSDSRDLPPVIRAVGEELARGSGIIFEMTVEGEDRVIHPFVGDELYRISAEALSNAFRHSGANRIEVTISYGRRDLCLRIADDGKGFDVKRVASTSEGHWGLQGMHERAAKIHARLTIESRPGNGAAVEVTVANSVAFRRADDARKIAGVL